VSDLLAISSNLTQGSGVLTKSGAGTLTLSGTNTFTGQTYVNGGTLSIGANVNLGAQATGATLNLRGGTLQATNTFGLYNGSAGTNNRAVVLTNAAGFGVTGGNTLTVAGVVSGSGSLTKSGTGTQILSGANTYTGATTVSVGTLLINGNSIAATGAIAVTNGAILGGAGTVGAAITSAGTLSPGDGTTAIGTFNATALTLNTGANFQFDLGGSSASDRIALTGAFTRGTGTSFSVNFNNTGVANSTYTLATFASLAGGFTAGNVSNFTYTGLAGGVTGGTFGLTGTDLTFTTVPEPATWALLAFSLTTVLVLRRRRNF
jgi:autotransporter-associated beta strand protein